MAIAIAIAISMPLICIPFIVFFLTKRLA